MPRVKLYGGLIQVAGGEKQVDVASSTVYSIINELISKYGEKFKGRVLDNEGAPANFVRIYVNNKDIRHLQGLETQVSKDDLVILMPAIGGGFLGNKWQV
tara:strand:+ start:359 stop:658 length:300 start_codon:yes stop_codon:yes gene_type:complete